MSTSALARLAVAWTALLAILAAGCSDTVHAPSNGNTTPPAGTENVYIVIPEDGITLNGRLFGAQNSVAVILSHMRPNDQTAWFDYAQVLAKDGFAVLTYDFRGYGTSEGEQDFGKLDDDLAAALRYMHDRGKQRVFLVGASMGGTASLVVASEGDVAGVVAISPPAQFEGQDALAALPKITAPTLLMASDDSTGDIVSLDQLKAVKPGVETQTYPGNAHGTNLLDPLQSDAAGVARQRIIDFLDEYRGP